MSARQKSIYMFFIISTLLFVTAMAYAHNPVIVKNDSSKEKPVLVEKPEISYAYYGELAGEPHYYKIVSSKPFTLYVNILVPDFFPKVEAITRHNISFQISDDKESVFIAEGSKSEWKRFYEPFGRDHYYMGPEFEKNVNTGTYYIKVFNNGNVGKYALAIGKKESFTPWDFVGAMLKAQSLDKWFFKPSEGGSSMKKTIIDFSKTDDKGNWRIVNDDVMGGVSKSEIIITDDSTAIFQGTLSLENYGGFASVRKDPGDYGLAGYDGIAVRVKGDGRIYQLRLVTSDRFDGISYQSEFQTTANNWIIVELPFQGFVPTFRGRIVRDAPELAPGNIRQIGFLIADKKAGIFKLEIDWIEAYMEGQSKVELDYYQWKNRLLLLFSPSQSHYDYNVQKKEIEEQMAEIESRDLVIFEIFEKGENLIGSSPMAHGAEESLRQRFNIKAGQFTMILVGKDGGEKLRRTEYMPLEEIFSIIDAMPMRQAELKERGK